MLVFEPAPHTVRGERLISLHQAGQSNCSYHFFYQPQLSPSSALAQTSAPLGEHNTRGDNDTKVTSVSPAPGIQTQQTEQKAEGHTSLDSLQSLASIFSSSTPVAASSSSEKKDLEMSVDNVVRSPSPKVTDRYPKPATPDLTDDSSESSEDKSSSKSFTDFNPSALPDPAETFRMQTDLDKLRERNRELAEIVDQQQREIDGLSVERDGLLTDVSNLQVQNLEKDQNIAELREQLQAQENASQNQIDGLNEIIADQQARIAELEKQVAELQAQKKAQEK